MSFDPFRLKRLRCSGTEGFADLNLPIPDVCIDVCRLPLFIVRATLRGLIAGLEARAGGGGARVSQSRSSLVVSFDRATGWVFARIMPAKTAANARRFLRDLHLACPILIAKILTDTGKEFTNRLFASRARAPYGALAFDWLCTELGIEHRLTPPKSPQTNGMVERFNGGIRDVLKTNHFDSALDLKQTVHRSPFTVHRSPFSRTDGVRGSLSDMQVPHSALGRKMRMHAMQDRHNSHLHLFVKLPRNHAGRDS